MVEKALSWYGRLQMMWGDLPDRKSWKWMLPGKEDTELFAL
jgi:hypothetical protein